jgi:outer membrane protein assembly factor BamB
MHSAQVPDWRELADERQDEPGGCWRGHGGRTAATSSRRCSAGRIAPVVGDASFAARIDLGSLKGIRYHVRVGRDVGRLQLNSPAGPSLETMADLASRQADCLVAGWCEDNAPVPQDVDGSTCPSGLGAVVIQPDVPRVTNEGGDAARTGRLPGPVAPTEPQEVWRSEGDVVSAPVVADGVVYVGTSASLLALDLASGEVRWCVPSSGGVAAIDDDRLIVATKRAGAYAFALDRATGRLLWRTDIGGWPTTLATDGVTFIGGDDNAVVALDPASGAPLWRFKVEPPEGVGNVIITGAASDGNRTYVSAADTLYALDRRSGAEVWRLVDPAADAVPRPGRSAPTSLSTPVVAGATVLVGSMGGSLYGLDATTGMMTWRYDRPNASFRMPAVSEDSVVYVGVDPAADEGGAASEPWSLIAIAIGADHPAWEASLAGRVPQPGWVAQPAVTDGVITIWAGSAEVGAVMALSARDGSVLWTVPTEGRAGAPVVLGETVLTVDDGTLRALRNAGPATAR